MKKNEGIFGLAKSKGYSTCIDNYERAEIYLVLAEIQKWLREEHNVAVFVVRAIYGHYGYEVWPNINKSNEQEAIIRKSFTTMSYSYETALMDGIAEGLKLI